VCAFQWPQADVLHQGSWVRVPPTGQMPVLPLLRHCPTEACPNRNSCCRREGLRPTCGSHDGTAWGYCCTCACRCCNRSVACAMRFGACTSFGVGSWRLWRYPLLTLSLPLPPSPPPTPLSLLSSLQVVEPLVEHTLLPVLQAQARPPRPPPPKRQSCHRPRHRPRHRRRLPPPMSPMWARPNPVEHARVRWRGELPRPVATALAAPQG
jgi:hypothetical protein